MISLIDASAHDAATAYAAIDRHQMDDITPHLYRTHDFGKSWKKITNGIPATTFVRAVREDPSRKGLLFAGTETGVYVSFNDGELWQPLQLNLPTTSVRDLVVKGNDLVVATHGRSFWILDDISPLRELTSATAAAKVHLFHPATAIRIRKNAAHDTPLPPETPAGKNPPAGAIIDFSLNSVPTGEVTLEIIDSAGVVMRKYSSNDQPGKPDETQAFPTYWFNPPAPLAKKMGLNRFVWDLRYERPQALRYGYSIAAAFGEDAIMVPEGPLALPGVYQVKLTVAGRSYTAPLEVKMDRRVKISQLALRQQFMLETRIMQGMWDSYHAAQQIRDLRTQLKELRAKLNSDASAKPTLDVIAALDKNAAELAAVEQQWPPVGVVSAASLNGSLGSLLLLVESADSAPTTQAVNAFGTYRHLLDQQLAKWNGLKEKELPALNTLLQQRQLPQIVVLD
jgi:hypothetical protein